MNQVSKIIIIIVIIIKKKEDKKKGRRRRTGGRERGGEIFLFLFFFSSLLYQIYGNRTMGFRRGYAWIPKSWSFVKLHEVGNFSTCVIFILKAI